jgi:hypothetical protein
LFLGNCTDREQLRRRRQISRLAQRRCASIAQGIRQAEHLQPVAMPLAGEQLGGTLADALEMLTAQKALVIERELQQSGLLRSKPQCKPIARRQAVFHFFKCPKK